MIQAADGVWNSNFTSVRHTTTTRNVNKLEDAVVRAACLLCVVGFMIIKLEKTCEFRLFMLVERARRRKAKRPLAVLHIIKNERRQSTVDRDG